MVYVTASGQFLPGEPVTNDRMADHIGRLSPQAERLGRLVLRQNRINTRHYAMQPDGSTEWTIAKMLGEAMRDTLHNAEIDAKQIGYLATSTTQNDLMVPGLASQVHGELGLPPLELASMQSVCASSMMALKSAWLQVKAGEHRAALVGGGEFASRYFRPGFYENTDAMPEDGALPGDAGFLRWTLSDGAAAVLLEDRPASKGLSLRIGSNGLRLSGGERRRLGLARALLRDAPWLVLDEPTEGLDVDTANALLRDLAAALGQRSLLMITHGELPAGVVHRSYRLQHGKLLEWVE